MGPRVLQEFAGRWRIERRIADARAGVEGRLEGVADFAAGEGGLVCTESGLLRYAGAPPMRARRVYLWRADGPGRIAVAFEDGREFHGFALRGEAAEAEHDCAPDRYRVRYDFSGWPDWRAEWRVRGPRKDYVSVTDYRRGEVGPG